MTWSPEENVERNVAALSPYLGAALRRAAGLALELHAEQVSIEHFLLALLDDEDCGAHQLIVHAFADPPTLYAEVMALSPGILVVGSGRSLPFSVRGVSALYAALGAREDADQPVAPMDLLSAAAASVSAEQHGALELAGLPFASLRPASADAARPADGSPFAQFDMPSKRALGRSCRVAMELDRASISPVHLILGVLDSAAELAALLDVRPARVRMALAGTDADESPTPERPMRPDAGLANLISELPKGATSAQTLATTLAKGPEELRLLLVQQRITPELLARSAHAFDDPTPDQVSGSL